MSGRSRGSLLCSVLLVLCSVLMFGTPVHGMSRMDIVDTAVAAGDFETLVTAVQAAGLADTLKGDGPFTVFAPTDDAFARLPAGTVEDLLKPSNREKLAAVLTYHVVNGKTMSSAILPSVSSVETANGQQLPISYKLHVNDARVVTPDIQCSNGVIHVIDKVLMPPAPEAPPQAADIVDTAVAAGQFNTLVAAVKAAGLVETLKGEGPFTVFAPTDDAFAKLPPETLQALLRPANKGKLTGILTYHVVPGRVMAADVVQLDSADTVHGAALTIAVGDGGVRVGNAKVVKTDIECSNGVIHVIDTVLMPPAGAKPAGEADIVDTAVAAGQFNTLVKAVKTAGLVETLKSGGPFTVFAPTDGAFSKLPADTVADLLMPQSRGELTRILTYHVVPAKIRAADLLKVDSATTVHGADLTFGLTVMPDDATVTKADIECSNGVIHAVDTVMMP
ncbi:MAG: fasciclin domain-containing protein [Candidatus Brocadiia bacterium]